ncbi:DUF4337 domain-containing protein [Pelomonas sp. KK5]|uniref:DUF4337 domain-containing protein n=1 Tax=Pelomonas sp. KK5 TaxID=1855730 RepID=UPI0009FA6795|nr:DUF4337 domain-containing protein [Pelomonas sp. KK5]
MDIDALETVESVKEKNAAEAAATRRLNAAVAISVALLATFMAICKVKDDNIVQAMQQAQAHMIDNWSYYQARNIRQEIAEANVIQLQAARSGMAAGADTSTIDAMIVQQQAQAKSQEEKKALLKKQAEDNEKAYNDLNFVDDQFDLSDALLAIAVALMAITALTELWWLFGLALIPTFFGVLMGLSGLLGWTIHPDGLIRLLS